MIQQRFDGTDTQRDNQLVDPKELPKSEPIKQEPSGDPEEEDEDEE